jgi:hypothetical protein
MLEIIGTFGPVLLAITGMWWFAAEASQAQKDRETMRMVTLREIETIMRHYRWHRPARYKRAWAGSPRRRNVKLTH